jgi:hypothetical protein
VPGFEKHHIGCESNGMPGMSRHNPRFGILDEPTGEIFAFCWQNKTGWQKTASLLFVNGPLKLRPVDGDDR